MATIRYSAVFPAGTVRSVPSITDHDPFTGANDVVSVRLTPAKMGTMDATAGSPTGTYAPEWVCPAVTSGAPLALIPAGAMRSSVLVSPASMTMPVVELGSRGTPTRRSDI